MTTDIPLTLRKFLNPEIVYGEGALNLAGRHAANLGANKVLLVTDPGVQQVGWTSKVEDSLREANISYFTYNNVTANPKDREVMEGAEVYRGEACDLIIAVGGGSPMDCAKGIGVVVGNPASILNFEGVDEVPLPGPPFIFIPTTAGSSADVSQFAIIADTARRVKITIISKMVIPDIALVDPETTVTMPPDLTAATGMDALCHAFEAYVSTASSPLTDMAAISAIELVKDNLIGAFTHPSDMRFRNNMMMASLMAGLAFSNASLGLVHAMAHSLGGALGLAHGECNALLLEEVVRYNYDESARKYDQIARVMGVDIDRCEQAERSNVIAGSVASLRKELGIVQRLEDMGVAFSDIPRLSEYAEKDPCLATNPRDAFSADIEKIYEMIYR